MATVSGSRGPQDYKTSYTTYNLTVSVRFLASYLLLPSVATQVLATCRTCPFMLTNVVTMLVCRELFQL